jgi:hypothetical protein
MRQPTSTQHVFSGGLHDKFGVMGFGIDNFLFIAVIGRLFRVFGHPFLEFPRHFEHFIAGHVVGGADTGEMIGPEALEKLLGAIPEHMAMDHIQVEGALRLAAKRLQEFQIIKLHLFLQKKMIMTIR